MNKKLILISALVFFMCNVQCRHRIDYPGDLSTYNEASGNSLQVSAKWMKYKEKKVDMGVEIRNNYKHTIVLKNHEMRIEMNGDKGYLTSPRSATFEMEPGEVIRRDLVFRFDQEKPRSGPVKLIITKVTSGTVEKPGKELPTAILVMPLHR